MVGRLITWFAENARDLPWRRTTDPYAVWVSEIMLQQTQVKTVIPFFERWMAALPDLRALARISEPELLKLWEGLGYYHRVRRMHQAARRIMEVHDGRFPTTHAEVLDLPGVGEYTAGAICSIAFNQPEPILDGNVVRVLARVLGIRDTVSTTPVRERLWREARDLAEVASRTALPSSWSRRSKETGMVLSGPCSALNQALMELGAVACLPRNPRCDICPIRERCICAKEGAQDAIPALPAKVAVTKRAVVVCVVERGGKFLVRQRAGDVHNSGFWEFPEVVVATKEKPGAALSRLIGPERRDFGSESEHEPEHVHVHVGQVRHSITRYRYTFEIYRVRLDSGKSLPVGGGLGGAWVSPVELDKLPLAGPHRKVLAKVRANPNPGDRSRGGRSAGSK